MSNSTPQGPGPEFGSAPDGSKLDETLAVDEQLDREAAELTREGDTDEPIDLSRPTGPELTTDVDDVDAG